MFGVGSWLSGKKPGANASTQSLDSLSELQDLDDAMRVMTHTNPTLFLLCETAAELILNDDVDGAENGLSGRISAFHLLGRGVVAFIRATLGFEQEIMRQASDRLNEAETRAISDQQRAKHNSHMPNSYHSEIYAPGTEFVLCQAMAQLMGAVIGVLNESLTESIKGFYKMRKAYLALDAILKMEQKFMQKRRSEPTSPVLAPSLSHGSGAEATAKLGALVGSAELSGDLSNLNINNDSTAAEKPGDANAAYLLTHDPDSDIFKNTVDVFVHSGANFCFGILLLLISMVPPAFSKLLGIIGFHGDKERALRMLWQASKFHNLTGAIAAFALLGYYNAFVRYCDIMPDIIPGENGDIQGYPRERLESLLAQMRERFPKSQLWLLEESRMNGANKKLDVALSLLCGNDHSPLKQVEALKVFEKSLNAMYLHRYELCATSFVECANLNSWSRSLYYYIAGSSHISLYRDFAGKDQAKAAAHAEKAKEYLQKAPQFAGKKRFMARQLPFDVFVTRKIAKWEARAKEWKVPLVDAVGVDPIEEMIFFWNGHSRMTQEHLEQSLAKLAWFESDANKMKYREGAEEKAILQLLRAAVLRSMRRHTEAKKILQAGVFSQDRTTFKGHLKDDWVYPVAYYEMAANLWMERPTYIATHGAPAPSSLSSNAATTTTTSSSSLKEENSAKSNYRTEKELVRECKEYLVKAAQWESYELDARVGLKVTAALEAVEKWESTHSTTLG
ncbi:outer membrane protein [Aspergillus ochraceoroseus]|uniref:Inclusion body clearance protein IML2 n=1 Tax=Aspergillus ochraceoroseus TaxID=138278 RepID=A0A0F8UWL0_9EURO|nr:outer membrane protein [Aspergillus ochraceoroseus]